MMTIWYTIIRSSQRKKANQKEFTNQITTIRATLRDPLFLRRHCTNHARPVRSMVRKNITYVESRLIVVLIHPPQRKNDLQSFQSFSHLMKRNLQEKERAYHEKSVLVKHIHKLLQIPFYLNTATMLFQQPIVIDPSAHTQAYRALDAFQWAFSSTLG